MNPGELAANALNTLSILLAGRNSVHTWWTGILGCAVFGWVFFAHQLYADTTLQGFFIVTSAVGWWHWLRGRRASDSGPDATPTRMHAPLPVRHCPPAAVFLLALAGIATAAGYGWLLHRFTDAYAPFIDSAVLAFSVLGQFLLMGRRVEAWWCWLLVNTIAVPLFLSRGLHVTAILYAAYWINALVALRHWRRLARETTAPAAAGVRSPSHV